MVAAVAEEPRGQCLGAWRVDSTAAAWPILTIAATLTTMGVLGIGAAFITHGPLAGSEIATFVGSVCMLAGPLVAVIGMRQLLALDEYVAALEAGVLLKLGDGERFVRWREVDSIRWDAEKRAIAIAVRDADTIAIAQPFGMIKSDELAARLDDLRRKAVFHLLG